MREQADYDPDHHILLIRLARRAHQRERYEAVIVELGVHRV